MPLLGIWGFHSSTPCDCGCATVKRGWHLDQVQAAVYLVPAHFSPASPSGLFGDGQVPSEPPSLGCCTALVWHMWSGMYREPSFAVRVLLILSMPCHAVLCHAKLCRTAVVCQVVPCCAMHCRQQEGCHKSSGRRGQTLLLWERPHVLGDCCAVLLRNNSARGMIDLVVV